MGTLWTWGLNNLGQLGVGDTNNRYTPTQVGLLSDWKSYSPAFQSSFAIKEDGTLWSWGGDSYGQLGLGDRVNRSSPTQVGSSTDWKQVVADAFSVLAIKSNGTLWGWGNNIGGMRSSPTQIGALNNWYKILSDYTSSNTVLILKNDNTLWGWGYNAEGELGVGDTTIYHSSPVQIGLGSTWKTASTALATLLIKTDGTLWATGMNDQGQLGVGDRINRSTLTQIGSDNDWDAVFPQSGTSFAIKNDGTLWSWGNNSYGQLGLGDDVRRTTPCKVGNSTWKKVVNNNHTVYAIKSDDTLWSWGDNVNGLLGQNIDPGLFYIASSPGQIGSGTWRDISGTTSIRAIKTNGTLWSWGYNGNGELGVGNTSNCSSPVQVGSSKWIDFSIRETESTGDLWVWGQNDHGELGLGDTTPRSSPTQVGALTHWTNISCGYYSSFALKDDGSFWSCGYNNLGQLAQNDLTNRSSLTQVGSLTDWDTTSHSFAIKTDGTLWAWGWNSYGQLGLGDRVNRSSPTQVGSSTDWFKIFVSPNDRNTLALKTDGTLWAWGYNTSRVLGLGATGSRSSPTQIGALNDWSETISSDGYSTVAIKNDGTLWAWGADTCGQLGIGTIPQEGSPTQVGALTTWNSIIIRNATCIATQTDGTLWSWGFNDFGQLGLGDVVWRSSPVQVGSLTDWEQLFIGHYSVYAKKTDNTLWSWGYNAQSQLGTGDALGRSSPVQIATDVLDVFVTTGFAFIKKIDGTLWGCGENASGQLGFGDIASRSVFTQIGSSTNWDTISLNPASVIALRYYETPTPTPTISVSNTQTPNPTPTNTPTPQLSPFVPVNAYDYPPIPLCIVLAEASTETDLSNDNPLSEDSSLTGMFDYTFRKTAPKLYELEWNFNPDKIYSPNKDHEELDEDGNRIYYDSLVLKSNYKFKGTQEDSNLVTFINKHRIVVTQNPKLTPTPTPTLTPSSSSNFISSLTLFLKNTNNLVNITDHMIVTLSYSGREQTLRTTSGNVSFNNLPNSQPITIFVESELGDYFSLTDEITLSQNNEEYVLLCLPYEEFDFKFVLTWGNDVPDLDSHLYITSTQNYHVYYSNRGSKTLLPFCLLDVDDVEYKGPETTTIYNFLESTNYSFSIHDYTNRNNLSNVFTSSACVKIYNSQGICEHELQSSGGNGVWWDICSINANREITLLNTYRY